MSTTERAYASDWNDFTAWCGKRGFTPLPASGEVVALYLRALDDRGLRLSTIRRRLAAIAARHRDRGLVSPAANDLVRQVLETIREMRELEGEAFPGGKAPLMRQDLRRMLDLLPPSLIGLRDRSILLLGFESGLRRSDLVALDVDDLDRDAGQLVVRIGRAGEAGRRERRLRIVERDPALSVVAATDAWISAAGIDAGPLYRPINRHGQVGGDRISDRAIALIVKRSVEAAGLDPARYAAGSLRSGARLDRRLGA